MNVKIGGAFITSGQFHISTNLIVPSTAFGDLFLQQKTVLNTPEDYNAWVVALKKDLKAYADKQGNAVKSNAQRAIDNIPTCDDKNKLEECKAFADSYLRPLNIPKDVAATWTCGFEAYKAAVKAISSVISGNPDLINWEVIKDGIEFIRHTREQMNNKKLQKATEEAKNMVESIQKKGESEKNLKELQGKLDSLNSGLNGN
jgi:hypothetical protein